MEVALRDPHRRNPSGSTRRADSRRSRYRFSSEDRSVVREEEQAEVEATGTRVGRRRAPRPHHRRRDRHRLGAGQGPQTGRERSERELAEQHVHRDHQPEPALEEHRQLRELHRVEAELVQDDVVADRFGLRARRATSVRRFSDPSSGNGAVGRTADSSRDRVPSVRALRASPRLILPLTSRDRPGLQEQDLPGLDLVVERHLAPDPVLDRPEVHPLAVPLELDQEDQLLTPSSSTAMAAVDDRRTAG